MFGGGGDVWHWRVWWWWWCIALALCGVVVVVMRGVWWWRGGGDVWSVSGGGRWVGCWWVVRLEWVVVTDVWCGGVKCGADRCGPFPVVVGVDASLSFTTNHSLMNSQIVYRRKDRGGRGLFAPVAMGFRFCLFWPPRGHCVFVFLLSDVLCCVVVALRGGSLGYLGEVWLVVMVYLDSDLVSKWFTDESY